MNASTKPVETGVSRTQIVNELSRSAHGKLEDYTSIISPACSMDPEFVAHLIAWDFVNGQVKDSKVALPVISLATKDFPGELTENSLAHLVAQSPRELLKAVKFAIASRLPSTRQKALEKAVWRYLSSKERNPGKWSRLAARHRRSLKSLYAMTRCRIPEWASNILFESKYVPGSVFSDIAQLSVLDPKQIAGVVQKWHLSPLVVSGAMAGSKSKQEDSAVVQAVIGQMSSTEVVTWSKSLERKGLSRDAALKETFRKKVSEATKSSKATLKTGVAAEEVEDDGLRTMLKELQERQIQEQKRAGRGLDGNWLVVADKSQSQEQAIELGKFIAATIAKFVTGRVWLVFCDGGADGREVTGQSLEQIKGQTRFVRANGNTSYGVGLQWAASRGLDLDGVVIVGDGGENSHPVFAAAYQDYKRRKDKDVPVYLYQTYCPPNYANSAGGNPLNFERIMGGDTILPARTTWADALRPVPGSWISYPPVPFTKYDLTHGQVDYYSIPNLVQGMSANAFGVVDKIMACPLLTLEQVLGAI